MGSTKINITKLSKDSGISRQQIMRKYSYLYEGRQNESTKVMNLKVEMAAQNKEYKKLIKKNDELRLTNKQLREKLFDLNIIIVQLSKKSKYV